MGQLSFWSADALPRAVGDLEGLLCTTAGVSLFGRGRSARLSVLLGARPESEPGDEPPAEDEPPADGGPAPPSGPGPVDPADVEFLDLEPEELARVFGGAVPVAPVAVAEPPPSSPAPDPIVTWRAHAVRSALRARGVTAQLDRHPDGRPVVRSAFRGDLVGLARGWLDGEEQKRLPDGFRLDGPRLRLWVLAAGAQRGPAYTLGLDPEAGHLHDALLTASRRAGLGATLGGAADAPVLRIAGRRRVGRLAELVGRPPRDLAHDVWPV